MKKRRTCKQHYAITTWPGLWKDTKRWIDEMEPEFTNYREWAGRNHRGPNEGAAYNKQRLENERRDMEILDNLSPEEYERVSRMGDEAFCRWMQKVNPMPCLKGESEYQRKR